MFNLIKYYVVLKLSWAEWSTIKFIDKNLHLTKNAPYSFNWLLNNLFLFQIIKNCREKSLFLFIIILI